MTSERELIEAAPGPWFAERLRELAVYIAPLGSKSGDTRWKTAETMRDAADEIDALRAGLVQCGRAMAIVVEGDAMVLHRDTKCKHGRYTFQGCESCTDAVLNPALESARAILKRDTSHDR